MHACPVSYSMLCMDTGKHKDEDLNLFYLNTTKFCPFDTQHFWRKWKTMKFGFEINQRLRKSSWTVFGLHRATPHAHWNVCLLFDRCICILSPVVWESRGYLDGRHWIGIWPGTSWPNTTVFSLTSYSRPCMNKYFKQVFNRSSQYILCVYLTMWTGCRIVYSNIMIPFCICPSTTTEKFVGTQT